MADDQTKIIISIETILKNLDRTQRSLKALEKQLKSLANIKVGGVNLDKSAAQAQKLQIQQQKLAVQSQKVANEQQKQQIVSDRLALAQLKLEQALQRVARAEQRAADVTARATQRQERARAEAARTATVRAQELLNRQTRAQQAADRLADQGARRAAQRTAALNRQQDSHIQDFRRIETENARVFTAGVQRVEAFGNSLRSLGQGITSIGFTLSAALSAPLAAFGVAATQASVRMDSLRRGLETIAGSAIEAQVQLARLTTIAKLPGIGFEEAIQGSIRLQAVGFSAEEAEKALIQFSNAVALTGGGRDELARITVQLGQLAAKGKVLAQDLKPIIEAAPAVGTALKQAFGTVNSEDIAELSGSSENFLKILIAQLGELPRAAGGARNAFDNFADSIFRASTAIGDAILPVLTKLADIALPIIEGIANAFRSLPVPIQTIIVLFGGILVALGPLLIIVGQLTLGVGRLAVAFAQLRIQAFQATAAIEGATVAAARSQATMNAVSRGFKAAGVGALALVGAVVTLVPAILAASAAFKEQVKVSGEQIAAQEEAIKGLESQLKFVQQLNPEIKRTKEQEQELLKVYQQLNIEVQTRLTGIRDEKTRLAELAKQIEDLIKLRRSEQLVNAGTTAGNLLNTINTIKANQQEIDSNVRRIQSNADIADSIRKTGEVAFQYSQQLAEQGINASNADEALAGLRNTSIELQKQNQTLNDTNIKLNKEAQDQVAILQALQKHLGLTAREAVVAARNQGLFQGSIEQGLALLDEYTAKVEAAANATKKFGNALDSLLKEDPLVTAVESADKALDRIVKLLSITSKTASQARTALSSFIEQFPQLKIAVERAGGLDKVIDKILGVKAIKDTGTSLRNAKERLAEQIKDLTETARDRTRAVEEAAGDELARMNELSFAQRLSSYREYLTARQELTTNAIDAEIREQKVAIDEAKKRQQELVTASRVRGIPETERVNRQAQAAKAEQEAIKAETKLIQLQSKRNDIINETAKSLAGATEQQDENIRQLQIEAGKLRGDLVSALQAEGVEPFLKRLKELSNELAFINQRLRDETGKVTAEEKEALRVAQERNKTETELILKRIRTSDAQAVLGQAEKNVTEAKEEQRNLEEDLAFQVDFRGRRELDAIRDRLAGEEQLKQTLLINRDIVQAQIDALKALGRTVPEEMQKFVEQMNRDVQSLGKLPFAEQFRIVEAEFNRINDERLDKIAEVEDAINRRTIAEIQGLLKIRLINAQYVGDLEEQSRLLTEIAKNSNDPRLIAQARQVEQTTRDANTELEGFSTRLRSVSIDALQQGLADFFSELGDNTKTAKERVLDLVNSITRSITDFIAQDFSRRIIESIFGTGTEGAATGFITTIKRALGIGGGGSGVAETGIDIAAEAAPHGAELAGTGHVAAAATALSTAGTTAATAITAGATAFAAPVIGAATSFASIVVGAASAFAGIVASAAGAQAIGGAGSSIAGAFAATGIFPAVPGGLVRIVEGGYPEAVLTTDPRHATQQVRILQRYLKETKGLFGRIPGFAQGGFDIARDAEAEMLQSLSNSRSGIPAPSPSLQPAVSGGDTNLRILNLWDRKQIAGGYIRSSEGARDIMNVLSENASEVSRRISIK